MCLCLFHKLEPMWNKLKDKHNFGSWPISYHAISIRIVKILHLCMVSKVVLITTVNTFCGYAHTCMVPAMYKHYISDLPKIHLSQWCTFMTSLTHLNQERANVYPFHTQGWIGSTALLNSNATGGPLLHFWIPQNNIIDISLFDILLVNTKCLNMNKSRYWICARWNKKMRTISVGSGLYFFLYRWSLNMEI